jgi:hypothetical protein
LAGPRGEVSVSHLGWAMSQDGRGVFRQFQGDG